MPGPVFLEGDRVALHTIEEEDIPFLQEQINDPAVRHHLTVRYPINEQQETEWFEEGASSEDRVNLMVVGDDGPSGTVGIGPTDDPDGSVEIGIWLREADWGNGYGTEASRLLVQYAFDTLRVHRVFARVFNDNLGSKRIWEKLGFRHEAVHEESAFMHGEYVDTHYFAVLEDEWREKHA